MKEKTRKVRSIHYNKWNREQRDLKEVRTKMARNYKHIYKWLTLLLCPFLIAFGYLLSLTNYTRLFIEINKDGFVNIFFVKNGWFWTTVTLFWCCYRYRVDKKRSKSILKRYIILTLWWYVFTQPIKWLNWPPIMDEIFLLTGGDCHFNIWDSDGNLDITFHNNNSKRVSKSFHILNKNLTQLIEQNGKDNMNNKDTGKKGISLLESLNCVRNGALHRENESLLCDTKVNQIIKKIISKEVKLNTSLKCRQYGGYWNGGHDPSGHIFLLTLMIMLLLGELPNMLNFAWSKYCHMHLERKEIDNETNGKKNEGEEKIKKDHKTQVNPIKQIGDSIIFTLKYLIWEQPVLIMIWFLLLWSWSLLVTTTSFHSLQEQLSGLFFAYSVAGIIYYNR